MKALFSIPCMLLFTGCFGILPTFPKMEVVEPMPLVWEDVLYRGQDGTEAGRRLHALTPAEWQRVQSALIDRRYKNNTCADIVNKYMEDYR